MILADRELEHREGELPYAPCHGLQAVQLCTPRCLPRSDASGPVQHALATGARLDARGLGGEEHGAARRSTQGHARVGAPLRRRFRSRRSGTPPQRVNARRAGAPSPAASTSRFETSSAARARLGSRQHLRLDRRGEPRVAPSMCAQIAREFRPAGSSARGQGRDPRVPRSSRSRSSVASAAFFRIFSSASTTK